ncbi:hypothetical protein KIN20_003529 [Parelaphostrongylus tenuis]|uniref:Reverse transcriptase domain-containing protein n=1 Tax=Parelaphostrongylus tenuis TaxID=148309 RepID=A0AAD5QDS8_PARTN|nr:hypothetical protein KIN20_003529 [Parelaphostrongylus tenuis]
MILDRLRNASPNNEYVMESFDVTALYTNVSNESAMQAICELLMEHERTTNMYGFSTWQVMALLKVPKLLIL